MNFSSASKKRRVCDLAVFDSTDPKVWVDAYKKTMDPKYRKGTRNFNTKIPKLEAWKKEGEPPIFIIPRERGGPSYKDVDLIDCSADQVFFAPVSKGYSMQDVSSFTLGPVVKEGLCIVNAAFSKVVCLHHIEGGGITDLSRKDFWKRSKKPTRKIELLEKRKMLVDGVMHDIDEWLVKNRSEWYAEWSKWMKSVALCSNGDFHWDDASPTVAYWVGDKPVDFVTWKKQTYIKPAYDLIPQTSVYKFLMKLWKDEKIPLGLVHPMARKNEPEVAITRKFIQELYEDEEEMCCMPYVVAGVLMGVPF